MFGCVWGKVRAEPHGVFWTSVFLPFKAPANTLQQPVFRGYFQNTSDSNLWNETRLPQSLQQLRNAAFTYKRLNIQGRSQEGYKKRWGH